MPKPKAKRRKSKNEILVVYEKDNGTFVGRYGWALAVSKCPLRAAALALKRRYKGTKPFHLCESTYCYGEWYGGTQEREDPIKIHQTKTLSQG